MFIKASLPTDSVNPIVLDIKNEGTWPNYQLSETTAILQFSCPCSFFAELDSIVYTYSISMVVKMLDTAVPRKLSYRPTYSY